ncbi:NF-kappa-B essential modulator-like [Lethenteron reissneri]|uniref:NF-kappa-B essential modulator-like n=1 Tax=Lethenteron reissneri TaxID=7753 RepID=UPI002AB6B8CB|nr:NF-kappa-B essential modulator-like [Lethenteron reissneri]
MGDDEQQGNGGREEATPRPGAAGPTTVGTSPRVDAGYDAELLQQIRELLKDKQRPAEQLRPTEQEDELKAYKTKLAAAQGNADRLDERAKLLERKFQEERRRHEAEEQAMTMEINKLRNASVADKKKIQEIEAAYKRKMEAKPEGSQYEEELKDAEQALVAKQEHIDKLKEELETQHSKVQNVVALREKVHELQEDLNAHERALAAKDQENRQLLSQLELARTEIGRFKNSSSIPVPSTQYQCPICNYCAPDYDTLEIHVQGCIT